MNARWIPNLNNKANTVVFDLIILLILFPLVVALALLCGLWLLLLLFFAGHDIFKMIRTEHIYHWSILYLLKKHSIRLSSARVSSLLALAFSWRSPINIFGTHRSSYPSVRNLMPLWVFDTRSKVSLFLMELMALRVSSPLFSPNRYFTLW